MIKFTAIEDRLIKMDCLAFAIEPWEKLFGCREAIMSRLAKSHKVLVAGPPNYFGDLIHANQRETLPKSGVIWRADQFYTLAPSKFFFTTDKLPLWDHLSRELRVRQIRRALKTLRFGPLALFLWDPMFVSMLGKFSEHVSCYYVYDDFAGFLQSDIEKRCVEENEERILRNVDIVFTAGAGLFAAKNKYDNAINVPNGVDYDLFSQAISEDTVIPEELTAIREPRLGYLGNINEKVDLEILQYLAKERPEWSIVFIGTDKLGTAEGRKKFETLRRSSNVYFLGPKPQTAIPGYLRGMNVCLIPYCMSGWSYFGCPLKLHEYLAAGKPVVASALPSVCEFSQVVYIARHPAEWVTAIKLALAENSPDLISRRLEVAFTNGWDKRIAVIEAAIASKAAEKRQTSSAWTRQRSHKAFR